MLSTWIPRPRPGTTAREVSRTDRVRIRCANVGMSIAYTSSRAGQIVVARLENEVTVKRYRQEGHRVWLLPENPDFAPIQVDLKEQELTIEGVVVGVVRNSV